MKTETKIIVAMVVAAVIGNATAVYVVTSRKAAKEAAEKARVEQLNREVEAAIRSRDAITAELERLNRKAGK